MQAVVRAMGVSARKSDGTISGHRVEWGPVDRAIDLHRVVFWPSAMRRNTCSTSNIELTVLQVVESAMREIAGQSDIQPILTGARQKIEQAVQVSDANRASIRSNRPLASPRIETHLR